MGLIGRLRRAVGRETFGPQNVDWCHGRSEGYVSVAPNGKGGTEVVVKCSQCSQGKWVLSHYECAKCGFDRYGTSCVKTETNGYRVTFACTECGHNEEHLQWED
jgi:hypothetical protein